MPQLGGLDPKALLRILMTGQGDPNIPGPQTPEQNTESEKYGYGLMDNMKLQGNAYYTPTNALADSIRGFIGGRRLDSVYGNTKAGLESGAGATTQGYFPGYSPPNGASGGVNSPISPDVKPNSPVQPNTGEGVGSIDSLVKTVAMQEGVDPSMLGAFVDIESGGKPGVTTGSYHGLMQLSPAEFVKYGGKGNIKDPVANLTAGARKLKAEAANFEQKYGRSPEAGDLYLIHQQGEGGYDAHTSNPDAPAWQNMYSTAEGQKKGIPWSKAAIWRNLPDQVKRQVGSVDNVSSKDFSDYWINRVSKGMIKHGSVDNPEFDPNNNPKYAPAVNKDSMSFNQPATMGAKGLEDLDNPSKIPGRSQLSFNQAATMTPEAAFPSASGRQSILDQSPGAIGQQVAQAGEAPTRGIDGKGIVGPPGLGAPNRDPGTTANSINSGTSYVPKSQPGFATEQLPGYGQQGNSYPKPVPGDLVPDRMPPDVMPSPVLPDQKGFTRKKGRLGPLEQDASVEPDLSGKMGLGMPGQPEVPPGETPMQTQAQGGGPTAQQSPNTGQLMDLPTNPVGNIKPEQLYNVLKNPYISPEIKKNLIDKAQAEGSMQSIPIEGGKLYFNNRTKSQTYVPEPVFKTESIKGINTNVMMIKPTMDGPWKTFDMESGSEINTTGGTSGGGGGGGGIERRADRAREIERKDQLSTHQTGAQSAERKTYIDEGKAADQAKISLQKMKQLENAPNNADLTTGPWADTWNEVKKNINTWLPQDGPRFKEGPMTLTDVYNSMSTVIGAQLARNSDPNPSVRQFEALVRTTPGIAQTPTGRKALLAALIHETDLRSQMGQIARSGKSQEQYDKEIQDVRKEYGNKVLIPPRLLENLKTREYKDIGKAKWLSNESEIKDVKIGEKFFTPDGRLFTKERD